MANPPRLVTLIDQTGYKAVMPCIALAEASAPKVSPCTVADLVIRLSARWMRAKVRHSFVQFLMRCRFAVPLWEILWGVVCGEELFFCKGGKEVVGEREV